MSHRSADNGVARESLGMGFITSERAFLHDINTHASGAVLHKHGNGGGGERVVLPGPDGAAIEVHHLQA